MSRKIFFRLILFMDGCTVFSGELIKPARMMVVRVLRLYTHTESNRNRRNRNPIFYPLNYGCISLDLLCKVKIFSAIIINI